MPAWRRKLGIALIVLGTAWTSAALATIALHFIVSHHRIFGPTWPIPLGLDAVLAVLCLPGVGVLVLGLRARRLAARGVSGQSRGFAAALPAAVAGAVAGVVCFTGAALMLIAAATIVLEVNPQRWVEPVCWAAAISGAWIGTLASTP
jgi:hypothetical protein